ncbi:hypothetical protein [Micromonospora parva]|uniref:hypothetical protein n=1 Tax=Micromonospora parva TaxID=1464048 RepID=UPI00340E4A69
MEHCRSTRSLSGFDAGVDQGISFDLSTALQGMIRNSSESAISLQWEQAVDLFSETPALTFQFLGSDIDILERAAVHLSTGEEVPSRETVVGRVHLLTKKMMGEPGVFGMETLDAPHRRVRVRLADSEEYHRAVRAHDEDRVLAVEGTLERDGNIFWLYGAEVMADLGLVGDFSNQQPPEDSEIPGQSFLFEDTGRLAAGGDE